MNNNPLPAWWELHLRKSRGEPLTEAEENRYDSELLAHDREASIEDLEALKTLRMKVASAEKDNAQLRKRVAQLEEEIQTVERALSQKTRALLGVQE